MSKPDAALVRAARGERPAPTPVWFMRQAGRSLPEYRAAREGVAMLDACRRPELVADITLQPVRRHGVDAAVLFSDIVVPLAAVGIDVDIVPGVGPVVGTPVRDATAVAAIRRLDDGDVAPITEAVRLCVGELGATPLVGFAGAPFTLASYLVEGGPSRDHARTKALMHGEPELWARLVDRLADIALTFLRAQVAAGASVVQLFDSWAGALSAVDYRRHVLPASRRIFDGLADTSVPRIHFGVGTGELLSALAAAGPDVLGVDWRVPLAAAAERVPGMALQGNLDPAILLAPWPVIEAEASRVLADGRSAPGHIFNLGHGVLPATDPGVLTRLVEFVHEATSG